MHIELYILKGIKMKKFAFIIMVATIILLCSCSNKSVSDNLQFQKTTWGMSMVEALDAYGITKEDTSYYDQDNAFGIKEYELFGEKTDLIMFSFSNFQKETPKLVAVKVTYPEGADMEKVLKEMRKVYGETVSEISIFDPFLITDKLSERKFAESEHLKLWVSTKSVLQSIPEKNTENCKELWEKYRKGLTDETWDIYSKNSRLITVVWTDNGEFPALKKNALDFDAFNLVVSNEIKDQLSDQ